MIITQYIFCSLGVIIDLKEHSPALKQSETIFALISNEQATRRMRSGEKIVAIEEFRSYRVESIDGKINVSFLNEREHVNLAEIFFSFDLSTARESSNW